MSIRRVSLGLTLVMAVVGSRQATACDPCSLYSASRLQGQSAGSWTLSVSDQYTDFEHAEDFKENSIRDGELTRSFNTTQIAAGYAFTDRIGVQLNLPVVYRTFDRFEGFRRSRESETGIGDIVLSGSFSPLLIREADHSIFLSLFGGVKLPTGDTGSLRSVGAPSEPGEISSDEALLRHHTVAAGGGRVLTLGTGSFDFPLGASAFLRRDRFLFLALGQYTVRTEGDFDYEFADDLFWDVGPGYYVVLGHENTVAARVTLSGENKASDRQHNAIVPDSSVSNIYLGPQLLATIDDCVSLDVAFDTRISEDNSDSVIASWRIRSGLTVRF